jgi:hypothetical protein
MVIMVGGLDGLREGETRTTTIRCHGNWFCYSVVQACWASVRLDVLIYLFWKVLKTCVNAY